MRIASQKVLPPISLCSIRGMQISTGTIVWEILIQFVLHFVFVHMTSFSLSTRVMDQSCSGEVAGNDGLGLLQAECGEKER